MCLCVYVVYVLCVYVSMSMVYGLWSMSMSMSMVYGLCVYVSLCHYVIMCFIWKGYWDGG